MKLKSFFFFFIISCFYAPQFPKRKIFVSFFFANECRKHLKKMILLVMSFEKLYVITVCFQLSKWDNSNDKQINFFCV